MSLHPELQDYHRQFEAIKSDARSLVSGLSDAQFTWRPEPGRWSVGQCLAHLNIIATKMLPAFERAIADGERRRQHGQGPFKYGWLDRWMLRAMEPPPKRRLRTRPPFVPAAPGPVDQVFAEFLALHDQLIERVRRANGLDLRRVKVRSPVNRLLRFSLGAYFGITAAHDRRHLWQARRVLERMQAEDG